MCPMLGSTRISDPLDGRIGIEIPFNRHFYQFVPPRPLEEIDADLKACTE